MLGVKMIKQEGDGGVGGASEWERGVVATTKTRWKKNVLKNIAGFKYILTV